MFAWFFVFWDVCCLAIGHRQVDIPLSLLYRTESSRWNVTCRILEVLKIAVEYVLRFVGRECMGRWFLQSRREAHTHFYKLLQTPTDISAVLTTRSVLYLHLSIQSP